MSSSWDHVTSTGQTRPSLPRREAGDYTPNRSVPSLVLVGMHQWLADLRSGIRMLLKYRTLSLVAVATLGVGIGLSTTVFSIVNGAMFKGLPFPDADRIVAVATTRTGQNQGRQPVSVQDLAVIQERQTSFDQIGAYGFAPL